MRGFVMTATEGAITTAALGLCACSQEGPVSHNADRILADSHHSESAAKVQFDRFKYRVPFACSEQQTLGTNSVSVAEIWGTRPTLECGGQYLICGTYELMPYDYSASWVCARPSEDTDGRRIDLEHVDVSATAGTFSLLYAMREPGHPLVSLILFQGHDSCTLAQVRLGSEKSGLRDGQKTSGK
jgi:hypothetical protein